MDLRRFCGGLQQAVEMGRLHTLLIQGKPPEDREALFRLQDPGALVFLQCPAAASRVSSSPSSPGSTVRGPAGVPSPAGQGGKERPLILGAIELGEQRRRPLPGRLPVLPRRHQQPVQSQRPRLPAKGRQRLRRGGQRTSLRVIELIEGGRTRLPPGPAPPSAPLTSPGPAGRP